jgi:hypothetical protein
MMRFAICIAAISFCVFGACPASAAEPSAAPIEFNRDIRPILADACYHCHGPDKARRKANLRFDVEADAKAMRDGRAAIVPRDLDMSELARRIAAADPSERMPPPGSGRSLTPEQIDRLRQWIAQGAAWQKHWAFIPPARPPLPPVKNQAWVRNSIDRFVLARLEKEGLAPAPEAPKATLIRRLSFDLTGLPPTPAELDQFLREAEAEPGLAYERLVDRLLASPRYGERMAWRWLEAARYADTNGYQTDAERDMWRWRDWVIEAYNLNLPFDRFTIEQIAGDMLPNPTLEQKIATGFNRNHRGNAEGGIVPEEYAVEYVVDRVETTATVWLGLTLGCARCHEHKYDPFTQREFYQMFAYFNNVPEKGRAVKFGNSPPYIKAPTREQTQQREQLALQQAKAQARRERMHSEIATAQEQWEKSVRVDGLPDWSIDDGLIASLSIDKTKSLRGSEAALKSAPGITGKALDLDGKGFVEAGNVGDFGFMDKFTIAFWINPRRLDGAILSQMTDEPQGEGYSIQLVNGKLQAHLTKRWLDDSIRVESDAVITPKQWHHVVVSYDGSRAAAGVTVRVDGQTAKRTLLDELNQDFKTKEPLRLGTGGGKDHRFDGLLDEVRIYGRVLDADEMKALGASKTIAQIVRTAVKQRTRAESLKLRHYFVRQAAPPAIREAIAAAIQADRALARFDEAIPTVMVMQEMPLPRDAFVLVRGEYDKHGEKVTASVPAALAAFPEGAPKNRLGLAQWLVDPANPLTARVAVNRAWQLHFGTGLVKTGEDFGTQGEYPTHPELLDLLATEFVASGWDLKRLHKTIVMSAVYRQASRSTKELNARDPDNRLLARGPRYRLSAEMIRDQALLAGGLLVEKVGGPSVKPYQPAGLWQELSGDEGYKQDHGENLYRRSLYTYWKRTIAPPALMTFDASARETCWVKETRTNTPLQALTLLNEVTYVEAARALAQRVLQEEKSPQDRVIAAFRRVLSRAPSAAELQILLQGLDKHRAEYRRNPAAARKLLSVGEAKVDANLDATELAALAATCSLIMNLDEAVTKE